MRIASAFQLTLTAAIVAGAIGAVASQAQTTAKPEEQASQTSQVNAPQGTQSPENTPAVAADKKSLIEAKADQRQKELADDTAKLYILANELKAEMDKSTKDTLSLTVIKKAEQVEKLAHKVREEMRTSLTN